MILVPFLLLSEKNFVNLCHKPFIFQSLSNIHNSFIISHKIDTFIMLHSHTFIKVIKFVTKNFNFDILEFLFLKYLKHFSKSLLKLFIYLLMAFTKVSCYHFQKITIKDENKSQNFYIISSFLLFPQL